MSLSVVTDLTPKYALCQPVGNLDSISSATFRDLLGRVLAPGLPLIIDMSRVRFVDAVGVRALAHCILLIQATGSYAVLCAASPHLKKVLAISGLDRIARIETTLTVAIARLAHPAPG